MSRLPSISSKDFIKFITNRGFVYTHTKGSHHVFKSSNQTVVVPERKEIGKGLLLEMINQIGLSREDFIQEWNNR